jgi:hypothetical protein
MTFKIGEALVAVCAICLLSTLGAPVKAQSASEASGKSPAKSYGRRTSVPPAPPQQYTWGGPPRQDSRDAYQGYFANPVDNPRYYGTGRATLIFRQ